MRDVPAAVVAIAIAIAGGAVAAVRAAVQEVVREVMVVAAPAAVADAEEGSSYPVSVTRRAAAMRPFPFGVAECGFTVAISRSWSDGRPRPSKRAKFARGLSTRDPGIKPW